MDLLVSLVIARLFFSAILGRVAVASTADSLMGSNS
jgi:hypothetical protein